MRGPHDRNAMALLNNKSFNNWQRIEIFFSSLFHQNQGERSLRYFPLDRHIRTPFYSVHHNAELEKRIALSQLAQILELNCRS